LLSTLEGRREGITSLRATSQYERLVGDVSEYPYVVAVTAELEGFATGILVTPCCVLTCNHFREDTLHLRSVDKVDVLTFEHHLASRVKAADPESDLILLELFEEQAVSANFQFSDYHLEESTIATAVGVQRHPGHRNQLSVSEIRLRCLNLNRSNGSILDIQFAGGARRGYSGGPVIVKQNGLTHCAGMIVSGSAHSSSTLAIGLAHIRAFLTEHLSSNVPSLFPPKT